MRSIRFRAWNGERMTYKPIVSDAMYEVVGNVYENTELLGVKNG